MPAINLFAGMARSYKFQPPLSDSIGMDKPDGQTELRILLLEDMPTDAELVEEALCEEGLSFIAKRVDTRDAFIRALEEFKPDIVLADYKLPAFDGGSAVQIVRQQYPAIPVVMVTGAVGDEVAIELLKQGAMDYVLKDRLVRLGPAVRRALAEAQDIRARKAAEKALLDSEARYRRITEGLTDYQYTVRIENGHAVGTTQSPACVTVTGYKAEEFAANPYLWIQMVAPQDRESVMEHARQILAGNDVPPIEHRIVRKDGESRWVSDTTILLKDASGKLLSYDGVIKDITERKQAEARIRKLTRLYATLSQTNQTIVRTTSRAELFSNICSAAVIHGKFVMAWVGLVDETTHMVQPVCHYGAETGYLTNIVISTDDVPAGRGPTGAAIRKNCVSHVNDYATDERVLPWREAALKRGFCGAAGLPLRFGNKVIGALTLYTDEPGFFDADQLNLLEEMATDISFALEGFEREALRRQALEKLQKALEDSIQMAASISEMRDPYTSGHQQRVSQLAAAIAAEMGLPEAQIDGIHFGCLIHDIGKIGVPAEILSRPSKLSSLEMQLIQIHPKAGYEIVKSIEFPWPVAQMILQHHERLDGSGYPAGLKGNNIITEAKIIAVADTLEAMSSHRPYRPSLGMDAALAEIAGASGTRYDKQAVDACMRLIKEKGFVFNPS
ncbi:MAG: GAF domain-containing protein [Gallionella sp.]|nr:GAF domain-containing protein [Gallionella sp.]